MTTEVSKKLLNTLYFFSFLATVYVIYDFFRILTECFNRNINIEFDTGTFYFLLISPFWGIGIIEYSILKSWKCSAFLKSIAAKVLVLGFIISLALANIVPLFLMTVLEGNGYRKCILEQFVSRVARGEYVLYSLDNCK